MTGTKRATARAVADGDAMLFRFNV